VQLYWADYIAAKVKQKSTVQYWHDEPNEPIKEGPLSYVLQETPFASVFNSQPWPPLSGFSARYFEILQSLGTSSHAAQANVLACPTGLYNFSHLLN
jgi:hypothetical protein